MSLSSQTGRGEPAVDSAALDGLFEHVPVGLVLLERGAVLRANPAFAALLGRAPEELVGRPLGDLVVVGSPIPELPRSGTVQLDCELHAADGRLSLVTIGITALSTPGLHAVSATDRTLDRVAERELFAQREFLRTVIDTVPGFVFVKDWDSRFLLANRALAEAYGTTPDAIVGKADVDFNPNAEEIEHFSHDDRQVIRTREPKLILSEKITRANGEIQWLTTIKVPVVDEKGNCTSLLGVATDITDLKRSEEAQARLQEQMLEGQKLESLGVLAGGIAHDFNNLLLAMLGSAEAALLEVSGDSPLQAPLQRIRIAALRAAELTNQLLAYTGKGHFTVETVDLNALVRDMAELLDVTSGHRAELRYAFSSDLPAVTADVAQLRQMVMNLITNAVDAMGDASGVVSLETGVSRVETGSLHGPDGPLEGGEFVFLRVADTGAGMDEPTLNRIFDPFFTTKFTGRGLGLAAVQGIVRGHGGAISVTSKVGEGSVFTVYLPSSDPSLRAPSRRVPAATPKPQGSTRTVLVIDDEPLICFTTRQLLELSGYDVLTATSGADAVELFGREPARVEAVLLDLTMPGIPADEILAALRRKRSDVKVVLMSGYDEQEIKSRLHNAAIAAFLQKPFTIDQLNETLKRVLPR
jgi:PAS domain S-box-containing protein